MKEIKIIHSPTEDCPFIILDKPSGLPTAPLKKGDLCALTMAADYYPEIMDIKGKKEIEGGLIHRIDNDTRGLVLIACKQNFYDNIQVQQSENKFKKTYKAICERKKLENTFPPFYLENLSDSLKKYIINNIGIETLLSCLQNYTISSYFRPFGPHNSMVRPVTDQSGMAARKKMGNTLYSTTVTMDTLDNNLYLATCSLYKGYRHQVRCHLTWAGFPIAGDSLYNPESTADFKFYASGLEFINPVTGKHENFTIEQELIF